MKYRVISGKNDLLPYIVQRKDDKAFISFWRTVTSVRSFNDAEMLVKRGTDRHARSPAGTVVFEYNEADLIVDKLKNQKIQNMEGVAMSQDTAYNVANGGSSKTFAGGLTIGRTEK